MGRTLRNAVSATILSCALAPGLAVAAGINLSWNDCGLAGTDCLTFTCDTNTGSDFSFVGSFVPPPGVTAPQYMECYVRILTDDAPANLPEWWRAGQCRSITSLAPNTQLGTTCADVLSGALFPPQYSYSVDTPNPGGSALVIVVVFPEGAPALDPGLEHYAFRMDIDRTKTTGTGSCPGCVVGTQIVLDHVDIFQDPKVQVDPVVLNEYIVTNKIGWQNPAYCFWTPVKRNSWGQIRSLYR